MSKRSRIARSLAPPYFHHRRSNSRTATSSSLSSEVSLFGGIESVLLREMTGLLYYRSIDGTEIFGAPPGLGARSRPSWAPTENGVTPPHGIKSMTAATG